MGMHPGTRFSPSASPAQESGTLYNSQQSSLLTKTQSNLLNREETSHLVGKVINLYIVDYLQHYYYDTLIMTPSTMTWCSPQVCWSVDGRTVGLCLRDKQLSCVISRRPMWRLAGLTSLHVSGRTVLGGLGHSMLATNCWYIWEFTLERNPTNALCVYSWYNNLKCFIHFLKMWHFLNQKFQFLV